MGNRMGKWEHSASATGVPGASTWPPEAVFPNGIARICHGETRKPKI